MALNQTLPIPPASLDAWWLGADAALPGPAVGRRARGRRGLRPRPLDAEVRLRPHPRGRRWAAGRYIIPARWARFLGNEPSELQRRLVVPAVRFSAAVSRELD